MELFPIVRENDMPREQEVATLHEKGISIRKLAVDLLYDREWCNEQWIRYYDLKSPLENFGLTAFKIAESFVEQAIEKYKSKEIANPAC